METEILYGFHPVREALRSRRRRVFELLIGRSPKDAEGKELAALAREAGVVVRYTGKDEVERVAPRATHQGIALVAEKLPVLDLEEALAAEPVTNQTIWVGLDGITDPHNLGAILRNAACFGASSVLVTERRSAGLTPLVQKTASGAAEYVRLIEATNLNQSILRLKKAGFWIYGAAVEGRDVAASPCHGPALLLIGSEGRGLRKKTREHADELVSIPLAPGRVASLNASSATAVMLYALRTWIEGGDV